MATSDQLQNTREDDADGYTVISDNSFKTHASTPLQLLEGKMHSKKRVSKYVSKQLKEKKIETLRPQIKAASEDPKVLIQKSQSEINDLKYQQAKMVGTKKHSLLSNQWKVFELEQLQKKLIEKP